MARGDVIAPLRRVAKAPELRRVQLAFLSFSISEHATWLAMLFYALQRGGPREVGLVAALQLLPGVVSTPFSAYAGDRFDPRRALAAGYAVQSLAMAGTAVAMWQDAWLLAYLLGATASTAICFTRPVMGSLLPTLTHSPADLVAANVVAGLIEQIGVFFGPLSAGLVIAATSPSVVFAGAALLTALACTLSLAVHGDRVDRPREALRVQAVVGELLGGFRAIRRAPVIRVFMVFLICAGLVNGISDVAFVTFADVRLDGTAGQSGLLAGAYGLGGLVGAGSVTGLIHGRRVDRQLAWAAIVLAVALLGLAAAASTLPAVIAFILLGGAESALALTSRVSIQRVAPTDALARVFGIVEAVRTGCVALGSLTMAVLVSASSLGRAFVVLTVVLMAAALAGVSLVRRHGSQLTPVDSAAVDRVLADSLLAALPAPVIERLARNLRLVAIPKGTAVITEGAAGVRFYLVVAGELSVTRGGAVVNTLDHTSSFGELALLRDAPRAATVIATSDVRLYALDRAPFLEAVTGHSQTLAAANRVVDSFHGAAGS